MGRLSYIPGGEAEHRGLCAKVALKTKPAGEIEFRNLTFTTIRLRLREMTTK